MVAVANPFDGVDLDGDPDVEAGVVTEECGEDVVTGVETGFEPGPDWGKVADLATGIEIAAVFEPAVLGVDDAARG